MQASAAPVARPGRRPVLIGTGDPGARARAAALLLTCLLVVTAAVAAQHGHTGKRQAHAAVVLAVPGHSASHLTPRSDDHAVGVFAPQVGAALALRAATADSSSVADHRTAGTPSVRGPPAETPA